MQVPDFLSDYLQRTKTEAFRINGPDFCVATMFCEDRKKFQSYLKTEKKVNLTLTMLSRMQTALTKEFTEKEKGILYQYYMEEVEFKIFTDVSEDILNKAIETTKRQINNIEEEERNNNGLLSDKKRELLLKASESLVSYVDRLEELRNKDSLRNDAIRKAIVAIGKLASEYIVGDDKRQEFLEKVSEYEKEVITEN